MKILKKLLLILLPITLLAACVPEDFLNGFGLNQSAHSSRSVMTNTRQGGPNEDCPEGTVLVAKFNFQGGQYVFEKPDGNENIVTITNDSETGGDFTSLIPISVVVVKGGRFTDEIEFNPPTLADSFSNAGLENNNSGKPPAISNVQFCAPEVIETPTATPIEPTATEVEPTATTVEPTATEVEPTATEVEPTATEVEPTATEVEPTATEVEPTATEVEPTATEVEPTATTVEPTATTVEPTATTVEPTATTVEPTATTVSPTTTPISTEEPTPVVTDEVTPEVSPEVEPQA